MKKYILCLVVFTACLMACEDEYFPSGFFPYQVEYMLTNDDQRTWIVTEWQVNEETIEMTDCSDSLRIGFEVISQDSTASYELRYNGDCSQYDTTFIGDLTASGSEFFTDTLYFERGNGSIRSYYVRELTASRLAIEYTQGGTQVSQYLIPEN